MENGGELGEHQGINLARREVEDSFAYAERSQGSAGGAGPGSKLRGAQLCALGARRESGQSGGGARGKKTPVIAKLEKPEAIENLDEILSVADGVMVARGDLGVEMNPEQVPVVQKQIISRARNALVPVITATQMLDSMTQSPRPTRAEASDVANAIFDGSDALMLSGETAVGRYPIESVEMMDRIIRVAETSITEPLRPARFTELHINETIAEAICHAAEELHMKAIAVFTESGSSARLVSKYRPRAPIIAFSPNQETRRRISLYWGVRPRSINRLTDMDVLVGAAEKRLLEEKLVHKGDVIGIISGTPLGATGTTNMMRLHRIGG